ncbi:IS3 family transposase [Bacillus sp. SRB3LM]|uniref:IS3 family transposase n=1 Tax=Bacillus sp. SRB3LM TaxID=2608689 RepID=UPI0035A81BA8
MKEDQFIISKIVECERDPDINGSYGYRRICIWLKKYYGLQINHKRVYRLMRKMGYRYNLSYL